MLHVKITQDSKTVGALLGVTEIRRESVFVEAEGDDEFEFDCIIVTNDGADHYFVIGPDVVDIANEVMENIFLNTTIDRAQLQHFRGEEAFIEWANS